MGQNIKQQYGFSEIRAKFPKGAGTKPCIVLWPGTERDSAGKVTWPYQIEYDLVETSSERNGGFCNVHYGTTNTQTGPPQVRRRPHPVAHLRLRAQWRGRGLLPRWQRDQEATGDYLRSKFSHRLGIQLDVASDGRTGPDTDMIIDWVRVARFK